MAMFLFSIWGYRFGFKPSLSMLEFETVSIGRARFIETLLICEKQSNRSMNKISIEEASIIVIPSTKKTHLMQWSIFMFLCPARICSIKYSGSCLPCKEYNHGKVTKICGTTNLVGPNYWKNSFTDVCKDVNCVESFKIDVPLKFVLSPQRNSSKLKHNFWSYICKAREEIGLQEKCKKLYR